MTVKLKFVLRCRGLIAFVLCLPAAPRPHHPDSRSGHCDEERQHPGVRQTRDSIGAGGRDVRFIRQS